MEHDHIEWCKTNYAYVKDGGVWAVPRSGLIFRKTATGYELNTVMPYTVELAQGSGDGRDVPASAFELLEYQRSDFEAIRRHHEAAGLQVTDPTGLLAMAHLEGNIHLHNLGKDDKVKSWRQLGRHKQRGTNETR